MSKLSGAQRVIGIDPSVRLSGCAYMKIQHHQDKSPLEYGLSMLEVDWVEGQALTTSSVHDSIASVESFCAFTAEIGEEPCDLYIEEVPPSRFLGNRILQQAGVYWTLKYNLNGVGVSNTVCKAFFDMPIKIQKKDKKKWMIEAVRRKINDPRFDTYLGELKQPQREAICDAAAVGITGYYLGITKMEEQVD